MSTESTTSAANPITDLFGEEGILPSVKVTPLSARAWRRRELHDLIMQHPEGLTVNQVMKLIAEPPRFDVIIRDRLNMLAQEGFIERVYCGGAREGSLKSGRAPDLWRPILAGTKADPLEDLI